ncbi:hypothetical protein Y032_0424g1215 [Ancylostoma ceylanicum]|uniref:ZP domain-containing protein n=1 Tax=Ancylostoma ceylanicum TaxID=53326 RepID=A0A016X224_9BILA|nr:hypothetical protein Y032_0424g1215 [Ancylostoma ceylanicum]
MNCLYILLAFLVLFAQGSDVEFDQESEHGHGHGGALPQVWYIMQSRTAPPLDCGTVEYDIFIEECQVGGTGKRSLTKIYKAFEEPSLSSLRCVALLRLC